MVHDFPNMRIYGVCRYTKLNEEHCDDTKSFSFFLKYKSRRMFAVCFYLVS